MINKSIKKALKGLKGISVQNMRSSSGNNVSNQFIIDTPNARIFQSYQSIIVIKTDDQVFLDKHYWNYSNTTGKYRNQFLHETRAETERKIKSGEYILADLT